MINCLPAPSRTPHEHSNLNPEVGARPRQAVTSFAKEMKSYCNPQNPLNFDRLKGILPA